MVGLLAPARPPTYISEPRSCSLARAELKTDPILVDGSSYDPQVVHIELFGIPRMKADRARLTLEADTIGAALAALAEAYPSLSLLSDGVLSPAYLVALNGRQFTNDPDVALQDGDVLVLVGAQAGG